MNVQSSPAVTIADRVVSVFDRNKLLILFIPFLFYMSNGREISSGDPTPTVFIAVNLAAKGTIYLDDLHDYVAYNNTPYYISTQRGHIVSNYPVFPAVMSFPVIAPFVWGGMIEPGDGDLVWKYLNKFSASLYTSLSVLLMYLTLKMLIDKKGALVLAYAYGFGTALAPIAAQSLWQHGPSVFWWTVCFYFLIRLLTSKNALHESSINRFLVYAGVAAGFAVLCRTVNGIGTVTLMAIVLLFYGRRSLWFSCPAAVLIAVYVGFNYYIFGSWKGGDIVLHSLQWELDRITTGPWATPLHIGLAGQLISPSRGMLVFSPFLLFAFWGMYDTWKRSEPVWRFIALMSVIPLFMLLVFSKYSVWWGGNSHFGPRYQIETFPFFILLIASVWHRITLSRLLLPTFIILLIYSVWVQCVGMFYYPGGWSIEPISLSLDYGRLWDWQYNQIWNSFQSGIKEQQWFIFPDTEK